LSIKKQSGDLEQKEAACHRDRVVILEIKHDRRVIAR
jgi:hypothetical protein